MKKKGGKVCYWFSCDVGGRWIYMVWSGLL